VALVTGAAQGIGLAIVKELLRAGVKVIGTWRLLIVSVKCTNWNTKDMDLYTQNKNTTAQARWRAYKQGTYMIATSIFWELNTHKQPVTVQVIQTKRIHIMVFG
jgi:3-oxoacyl-ACP reductase-like protein